VEGAVLGEGGGLALSGRLLEFDARGNCVLRYNESCVGLLRVLDARPVRERAHFFPELPTIYAFQTPRYHYPIDQILSLIRIQNRFSKLCYSLKCCRAFRSTMGAQNKGSLIRKGIALWRPYPL
jgi:hypothetical protein